MPSLEDTLKALNALYNNPDASIKEEANSWLEKLQKSVSHYFIAQTPYRI